jgi:hypothetical protein
MEFTESVTGLQHATPGEVLVCQIDERYLNSRAGLRARGTNAERSLATDRSWPPFNVLSGPSAKPDDRKFRSLQAASSLVDFLADSFLCSVPFDETERTNSMSRVYNSHHDA